jgi:hypothetical protein
MVQHTRKLNIALASGAIGILSIIGVTSVSAASIQKNSPTEKAEHYQNKLSRAVANGKITANQEALILAEHNKLISELKTSSTTNDRKTLHESVMKEAKLWAAQNNVDLGLVMPSHNNVHMGRHHNPKA